MAEDNTEWRRNGDAQDGQPQTTPAAGPEAAGTQAESPDATAAPAGATPAKPGDDTPDYAAAKGERTVVSNAPAADSPAAEAEQSAEDFDPIYAKDPQQYRPAPEYGAYGPVPTPPNGPQQGQPGPMNQSGPMGQPTPPQPGYGQPAGNPFYGYGQPMPNGPQQGQQGQPGPQPGGPGRPASPGNPFAPQPGPMPGGQPGMPGQGQPAAGKPMGQTARMVVTAVITAIVAIALSLGLGFAAISGGWITVPGASSLASVNSNQSGSGSAKAKSGEAPDWQAVASDVSGSVVAITTRMQNGEAKGSGAIIDGEKGYIVTNNHVISGAQKIQVTLSNGQIYSAQAKGTDTTTDLAVIQLDNPPSGLKAVEFADSDKLAVGEPVMAVGNPLGYDDTATTGIVSALNRPVSVVDEDSGSQIVTNAVQIDAAVNPGNSGGPSFNAAGQVIGINSSIASTASSSSQAGSIGIGFAIPSNLVKRVADEIIKDGKVQHVALGVTIRTNAVEADGVTRSGAQIVTPSSGGSAVVSGGPADKAGLKVNDTIVAFDGKAVNSSESLLGFVRAASMGDTAKLTIVRDGKTMDVTVTLDQPEQAVTGSQNQNQQGQNQDGQGQRGQGGQNGGQDGSNPFGDGGGLWDPFGLW